MQAVFAKCGVTAPSSCCCAHIAQTDRCVNGQMEECVYSLRVAPSGYSADQGIKCECAAELRKVTMLGRFDDRVGSEMYEAYGMIKKGRECMSKPSGALWNKEITLSGAAVGWHFHCRVGLNYVFITFIGHFWLLRLKLVVPRLSISISITGFWILRMPFSTESWLRVDACGCHLLLHLGFVRVFFFLLLWRCCLDWHS